MNPQDSSATSPGVSPGEKLPVAKPTVTTSRSNQIDIGEVLFRTIVFSLLTISLATGWWTFTQHLLPRQEQARDLGLRVSQYSMDVDEIERKWPETAARQVSNQYAQVHSTLFSGRAALESWWTGLNELAGLLALDVRIEFADARPQLTNREPVAVIPAILSIEAQPASSSGESGPPYQRLLRLCRWLASGEKRADVVELTVTGGTNSASQALMTLHLWAGEEVAE